MGYSYSPYPKEQRVKSFFGKRGRHLAIVAVLIFLLVAFYSAGNALTGFATYSSDLKQQLDDTNVALAVVQGGKEMCENYLDEVSGDIKACRSGARTVEADLEACSAASRELNKTANELSFWLDTCRTEKEAAMQSFKQLIRNSVKVICCSFGDVQDGTVRYWNIVNSTIVCNGGYTVNCSNGETNY